MAGLANTDGTPIDGIEPIDTKAWAQLQAQQARSADAGAGETVAAPPRKDAEAPFGRTKDGAPKKAPGGRPPKARVQQPTKATAPAQVKDFTPGLETVFRVAWMATATTSPADAGAILTSAPALVKGWNELGQRNEVIGKALNIINGGAETSEVVFATLMLGAQIAANHGVESPLLTVFGVRSPRDMEQINAQAIQEMAAAQQAA